MDDGEPTYERNGEVEAGFASQKYFIGLYILRTDVMAAHRGQLKGKGAIRYSRQGYIDFDVVESVLWGTMKPTGPVY